MSALENAKSYGFQEWMVGIIGAFTSGGAAAITSSTTVMMLNPEHFNLQGGLKHTLTLIGMTFLISGIVSICKFLQVHPAPVVDAGATK